MAFFRYASRVAVTRKLAILPQNSNKREVVVAQLVERSLSIPEDRGLTPVISKINI